MGKNYQIDMRGIKTLLTFFILCIYLPQINAQEKSRIIEDGGTGDYPAIMLSESSLPSHTVFRPQNLDSFGGEELLPIITWGNGACANSPWEHVNFLNEVASHGFIVIAIGPMPEEGEQTRDRSTSGQLLDGIEWAIAQAKNKNSIYYNKLDTNAIAVSGMSCGGLQTLEVAGDPRIKTIGVFNSGILPTPISGMPGMPQLEKSHLEKIHTPTLYLLGGESDIAYNNGMDDYNRINHVPVYIANMDVGHGGTYQQPNGGEFARVATAWYLWQLKNDKKASSFFVGDDCILCNSEIWTLEKKIK